MSVFNDTENSVIGVPSDTNKRDIGRKTNSSKNRLFPCLL